MNKLPPLSWFANKSQLQALGKIETLRQQEGRMEKKKNESKTAKNLT